jgi:hypothetical protein
MKNNMGYTVLKTEFGNRRISVLDNWNFMYTDFDLFLKY